MNKTSRQSLNHKIRQEVFEKYNWKCQYCGKNIRGFNATIDHIKQVYLGGGDDVDNLTAACRSCNSARGAMDTEEFMKYIKDKKQKAMSKLGAYGGSQTLERHGREHFSKIAKLSWLKRKSTAKITELK